jgi:hypothetical protein
VSDYKELGHLGDGVYLSDDGYQLWLAVNHHDNKVVALEPIVALQLVQAILKHHFGAEVQGRVFKIMREAAPK